MLTTDDWTFQPNDHVQRWLLTLDAGSTSGHNQTFHQEDQRQRHHLHSIEDTKGSHAYLGHQNLDQHRSTCLRVNDGDVSRLVPDAKVIQQPHQVQADPTRDFRKRVIYSGDSLSEYSAGERSQETQQLRSRKVGLDYSSRSHPRKYHRTPISENENLKQHNVDTVWNASADPSSKYTRRLRYKTRENRYEFKGDQTSEKPRTARDNHDVNKRRKKRRKTGATLENDFQASNIDAERLTLRRTSGATFLSKGKSSAAIAHRDLPDLTFPGLTFLSRRRRTGETREATKLHDKTAKRHDNRGISEYFAQVIDSQQDGRQSVKPNAYRVQSDKSDIVQHAVTLFPTERRHRRPHSRSQANITSDPKWQRIGRWAAYDAITGVSQYYPPSPQAQLQDSGYEGGGAPISWSTSPLHHLKSAVNQSQRVIHDEPLQRMDDKNRKTDGSAGNLHMRCSDPAQALDDSLIYQYTREVLLELRRDPRRCASLEVPSQQEISLDDLKHLARESEVHINADTNMQQEPVQDHTTIDVTRPSLDKMLISCADSQSNQIVNNSYDANPSTVPRLVIGDHSSQIHPEWNLVNPEDPEQLKHIQIKPSSMCNGTKQHLYGDRDEIHALYPRTSLDNRNTPQYPRLDPLPLPKPTQRFIIRLENERYRNNTSQGKSCSKESGFDTTRSPSMNLVQYDVRNNAIEPFTRSEDLYQTCLPLSEISVSFTSGLSSPILSPSKPEQSDSKLIGTCFASELWQDTTPHKYFTVPDHASLDTSHAPVQQCCVTLNFNAKSETNIHDGLLNKSDQKWIDLAQKLTSPQMRSLPSLTRPYLLF